MKCCQRREEVIKHRVNAVSGYCRALGSPNWSLVTLLTHCVVFSSFEAAFFLQIRIVDDVLGAESTLVVGCGLSGSLDASKDIIIGPGETSAVYFLILMISGMLGPVYAVGEAGCRDDDWYHSHSP